jgi:hypothetical protein
MDFIQNNMNSVTTIIDAWRMSQDDKESFAVFSNIVNTLTEYKERTSNE